MRATAIQYTSHRISVSDTPPPIPSQYTPGFIPKCATCDYDLSNLPDGRCPECGGWFSAAVLHSLWIEKSRPGRLAGGAEFLVAIPTGLSLVVWWITLVQTNAGAPSWIVGAVAAVFSMWWTWICREQLLVSKPDHLLVTLLIAVPMCMIGVRCLFWLGLLGPAPWIVGTLLAWSLCRNRHRLVPGLLIGSILIAPGVVGLFFGGLGMLRHEHWSEVDKLLPGDPYRPIPVSNQLECLLGAVFMIMGAAVLCLGAVVGRKKEISSVQPPSATHRTDSQ